MSKKQLPRQLFVRRVDQVSGGDPYLAADVDAAALLNIDDADEAEIGVYRLVETRRVRHRVEVVSSRKA